MKRMICFAWIALLILGGCKKEVELPKVPKEEYSNEGERVVLFSGEKSFPISFTVDGQQKIENGTYFYYDIKEHFDRDWKESFYLYDIRRLELLDFKEQGSFGERDVYATNGNWPLFLNPVHIEYSASNQDQVDEGLINAGNRVLKQNKMEKEPLIITDVWLCDMDSDGVEEQFFAGCNYLASPSNEEDVKAQADEVMIYSFLAYLDEENCQLLSGSFRSVMSEHKDEGAASVLHSFSYDNQGELKEKILKKRQKIDFVRKIIPMICDPDGDQVWSVYVYKECDFNSLTLMDFKNGSFIKTFEILY